MPETLANTVSWAASLVKIEAQELEHDIQEMCDDSRQTEHPEHTLIVDEDM